MKIRTPAGLPKEAAPFFRDLVKDLYDHGVEHVDAHMLQHLAVAQWVASEAARDLARNGMYETDEAHGNERRKSPAWTVWRQAVATAKDIGVQFGLTIASRQRLKAVEPEEQLSLAELLFADVGVEAD